MGARCCCTECSSNGQATRRCPLLGGQPLRQPRLHSVGLSGEGCFPFAGLVAALTSWLPPASCVEKAPPAFFCTFFWCFLPILWSSHCMGPFSHISQSGQYTAPPASPVSLLGAFARSISSSPLSELLLDSSMWSSPQCSKALTGQRTTNGGGGTLPPPESSTSNSSNTALTLGPLHVSHRQAVRQQLDQVVRQ